LQNNTNRRISESSSLPNPTDIRQTDPRLALIVERWDSLPEAVRAGIVAMVRASGVTPK
jgi:hypothetical protein